MSERQIFRPSAITALQRGMEKDTLPRLITWPIVICLWLLLTLFLAAAAWAWSVQVPTYLDEPGIIVARQDLLPAADGETVAVLFLPPEQASRVRPGAPVQIMVGSAGTRVQGVIAYLQSGLIGPAEAQKYFPLSGNGALPVTQPSIVAIVKLTTPLPAIAYAGSPVTSKVEIGSRRLVTLLPGFEGFQ